MTCYLVHLDQPLGSAHPLGLDSPAKLELYAAQDQVREQINVRAELAGLVERIRQRQGMTNDQ